MCRQSYLERERGEGRASKKAKKERVSPTRKPAHDEIRIYKTFWRKFESTQ